MSELNSPLIQQALAQASYSQDRREYYAVQAALQLYRRARNRGRWGRLWSTLLRRPRRLLDLSIVERAGIVRDRCHVGARTVPLCQVQGSEGRCNDFDAAFYPLRDGNRDRWLNIAMARWAGTPLPPVALIQVGDVYFVRDGHHRISVARALGQQEIDAVVTVWDVVGVLPWECRAPAYA